LAEKPLPDLLGACEGLESARSRRRAHQEEFRANGGVEVFRLGVGALQT
jgi:hypothetical protein